MALSGSFSFSQRSGKETVRIDWIGVQNVANNTTTITAKMYFINQYALSIGARTHTIIIDGTSYTINSSAINTIGERFIGSVSKAIAHSSDGSKSFSISATFSLQATLSGVYYESISGSSGTIVINTIPRASTINFSATSIDMGSNITITTNRASNSFTHTLTYSFGSTSGSIGSGVGASINWTPSINLAGQIPNATSATATITCKTYNGSTLIGTTTKTITLTVPATVVPVISKIDVVDYLGYSNTFGAYVQNKSKAKITVTSSGSQSSTIKSYKIVANGATYTANNSVTDVLKTSGSNTITVTVTDSRNRTASKTTAINVLAYTSPTVNSLAVSRCDSSGTADEEGNYMKVIAKATISSLNGLNSKKFLLQYKKENANTFTTYQTYSDSYTYNVTAIINIGQDDIYNVNISATDYFLTSQYQKNIETAYTLVDFNANGKGIAFGKASTQNGLDVNMDALFRMGLKGGINVVNTSNTNLDDYLTDGLYNFAVEYAPKGVPAGSNGWLQVFTNGTNSVAKQVWYRHGTANTNDWETYIRTKTSSNAGWSTWVKLVVPSDTWKGSSGGGLLQTISVSLGSRTYAASASATLTQTFTLPTGYSSIGIIGVNCASTAAVLTRYAVAADTVTLVIRNISTSTITANPTAVVLLARNSN